jgi:hypothetical protein
MAQITEPFVMTTSGKLAITVKTLRIVSDPAGAVTLAPAKP